MKITETQSNAQFPKKILDDDVITCKNNRRKTEIEHLHVDVTCPFGSLKNSRVCLQCVHRVTCETRDVKYIRLIPMCYDLLTICKYGVILFCKYFERVYSTELHSKLWLGYCLLFEYFIEPNDCQFDGPLNIQSPSLFIQNFEIIHHAADFLCNPLESFVFPNDKSPFASQTMCIHSINFNCCR